MIWAVNTFSRLRLNALWRRLPGGLAEWKSAQRWLPWALALRFRCG